MGQSNEDGTYLEFDNCVHNFTPIGVPFDEMNKLIPTYLPTLLVRGLESWASDPIVDGRTKALSAGSGGLC